MAAETNMITLRSSDGEEFVVDEAVAMMSNTVKHMIEDDCAYGSIPLPNVAARTLAKVIEYCRKHAEMDEKVEEDIFGMDRELNAWDKEYVKVDQSDLFDLLMGDKVRKHNDWMNWPLPPNTVPPAPGPIPPVPSGYDILVTRFDGFTLDGSGIHAENMQCNLVDANTGVLLSRTSSEDSNHSFHNYEGASRGSTQASDASLTSGRLNKTDSY